MDPILYRLRAFTDKPLGGNPAGVICFEQFPSAEQLQQLAWQSAQPVTAMVAKVTGGYQIRWFTPQQEINLCGHGTLAAAT
ncbi:MAG: PhzF family phenazine biosynthesis protein, partial [Gammaproteobacteria bacterium]|nr:PhzF family phenazine biosynthesis protein [Gammaproteobacteria bacterium]